MGCWGLLLLRNDTKFPYLLHGLCNIIVYIIIGAQIILIRFYILHIYSPTVLI